MSKCFTTEEKDGKIWIVNNGATHIDGEPFKYKQIDKCRAEMLCEELNDLFEYKVFAKEVLEIIHCIKSNLLNWSDLDDYIYKGINIDELRCKYDDLYKAVLNTQKGDDNND